MCLFLSVLRYSEADQIQFTLDEEGNINRTGVVTVNHNFVVSYVIKYSLLFFRDGL